MLYAGRRAKPTDIITPWRPWCHLHHALILPSGQYSLLFISFALYVSLYVFMLVTVQHVSSPACPSTQHAQGSNSPHAPTYVQLQLQP
mmetsp:Transcript_36991/g.82238  ORF Transcript_36991/g.82238 Transcript_36991/m.82238 type:complete len:88 (+) Transcript_36991:469-732(+)